MRNYLNRFKQLHSFLFLVFIHTSIVSCGCRSEVSPDNDTTSRNTSTVSTSTRNTSGSGTGTPSSGPATPGSDPNTSGSGTGTPDSDPNTSGPGTGTPGSDPDTFVSSTDTPGSTIGTPGSGTDTSVPSTDTFVSGIGTPGSEPDTSIPSIDTFVSSIGTPGSEPDTFVPNTDTFVSGPDTSVPSSDTFVSDPDNFVSSIGTPGSGPDTPGSTTGTFGSSTDTFISDTGTFDSEPDTPVSDIGTFGSNLDLDTSGADAGTSSTGGGNTITDGILEATELFPGLKKLLEDIRDGNPVDLDQKIDPQFQSRPSNQPVGLIIDLLTAHGGNGDPAKAAAYKVDRLKILHELITRGADLTQPKFIQDKFNILFQLINLRRPDLINELMQYKDRLPIDTFGGKTVLEYAKAIKGYDDQQKTASEEIVKSLEEAGIN